MSEQSEAAASVAAVVRSYVDAAARRDDAAVCSYLSDFARSIVLATAADSGLTTDSCEVALAHVRPLRSLGAAQASVADFQIEVLSIEDDRATVEVRTMAAEASALALVRERGAWKIAVATTDPRAPR
jgi:hypothetical protein